MAEEKRKRGYPKIPRANWFGLREKFRQKPPAEVTASYIASALGIGTASAANLIPPLKQLGLVNDAGRLTDLAFEWRDDETYAAACEKILEATYPQEIRDLFHTSDAKFKDVANWFARDTRQGESVVGAYAGLYLLLLDGDPSKGKEAGVTKQRTATPKAAKVASPKPARAATVLPAMKEHDEPDGGSAGRSSDGGHKRSFSPSLHVDIQIHISPDSTPEQIDKIFESMAKHLPIKG